MWNRIGPIDCCQKFVINTRSLHLFCFFWRATVGRISKLPPCYSIEFTRHMPPTSGLADSSRIKEATDSDSQKDRQTNRRWGPRNLGTNSPHQWIVCWFVCFVDGTFVRSYEIYALHAIMRGTSIRQECATDDDATGQRTSKRTQLHVYVATTTHRQSVLFLFRQSFIHSWSSSITYFIIRSSVCLRIHSLLIINQSIHHLSIISIHPSMDDSNDDDDK